MSWKAEVTTDGHSWAGNALRFADKVEAEFYVADLFMRWTSVRATRVVEVPEEVATDRWDRVNHRIETLVAAPPRPLEPNSLKKGTRIKTHDGDEGYITDNKLGIRRLMHIGDEIGSAYVDRIKCAMVDGVWHPVRPSKEQARKLYAVHKDLDALR